MTVFRLRYMQSIYMFMLMLSLTENHGVATGSLLKCVTNCFMENHPLSKPDLNIWVGREKQQTQKNNKQL